MTLNWEHCQHLAELVLFAEPESPTKRERVAWLARSIQQAVKDWLEDNPSLDEEILN